MNIIYILLALAVWGFVHSIMASLEFKTFLKDKFGLRFMRWYRLLFNIFSLLTFLPILYLVVFLPDRPLYLIPKPMSYLMLAGQIFAVVCLIITLLQTDSLAFVGIKQLFVEDTKSQLVTNGFYRFIRHPLYTFSLLALWLTSSMSLSTLIFFIGVTLYFVIGAYFEERKLTREFGQAYLDYKRITPMFIPWRVRSN